MLNTKFAQGYDLKLKKEPLVIVLVNDPEMREVNILQMFGRSSRRQGTLNGAAYLLGNTASRVSAWTQIQSRDRRENHDGGVLINKLLKNQEKITPADIKLIKSGMEAEKWKVSYLKSDFSKDPFLKLLNEL